MRFMMLMIPKGYESADARALPSAEMVAEMTKYNEALAKAGVLLALDGLHPPAAAARLVFADHKPTIVDRPFAETKETVGGYWIIQSKSKAEALQWASRCPAADGDVIELRQIMDISDFPPELVAEISPELRAIDRA
ncbi:MAG TPA: YciI family protein [Polyangiales bacterium]